MNLKKSIVSGAFWILFTQIFSLLVVLAANYILARLLDPKDFGDLGVVMPFIFISNILTEGGLTGAVVRKLEIEEKDYSTLFVFNLAISLFFYFLLFLSSGYISDFYQSEQLKKLLIVASSVIVITSFQVVQNAKLVREMKFKQKSLSMLIANVTGAVFGVVMAYFLELGIWSLIGMPIITNIVLLLMYSYFEGFYFNFKFSFSSLKSLYKFGVNTTVVSLLNVVFDNIYQLILGKMFSINQVGFYYQAKKLQDVPNSLINNMSQGVVFSALSKLQDNEVNLQNNYKNIIQMSTTFIGFSALFMFNFAEEIVHLLLGDQWGESAFYIQMLCVAGFFYSQELVNKTLFKVFNRTDIFLKLELFKKVIHAITIGIGVYYKSIETLLFGFIVVSLLSYVFNYFYTQTLFKKKSAYEIKLTGKVFLIVVGISYLLYLIMQYCVINFLYLIPVCAIVYFVILHLFKIYDIKKIMNQIKNR